jgi:hypothetical protein
MTTRSQEPGARSQEPGARSQEPGTTNQEPRTRSQGPGTTNQEPGTRDQGPGTTNQEPGTTNRELEPLGAHLGSRARARYLAAWRSFVGCRAPPLSATGDRVPACDQMRVSRLGHTDASAHSPSPRTRLPSENFWIERTKTRTRRASVPSSSAFLEHEQDEGVQAVCVELRLGAGTDMHARSAVQGAGMRRLT